MSHSSARLALVVPEPFEESLSVKEGSQPHSLHALLPDSNSPHPDVVRHLVSNTQLLMILSLTRFVVLEQFYSKVP